MADITCAWCSKDRPAQFETASVHSNVRQFKSESFAVWRCPHCQTIHARDEVDLDRYYAGYPFHHTPDLDWRARAMYRSLLRRLTPFGVTPRCSLLDYGCGGGLVIRFLREQGFSEAVGFDEYSQPFNLPELLERQYDVVLCQDVIEHVADPRELLQQFDRITKPGGLIALGTPNASAIDLGNAAAFHHVLHQPYHRHMLSERALLELGDDLGWRLERYYPSMYVNTLVPFINARFALRYYACFDDTLDVAFEPPTVKSWRFWSPVTFFWAFFGWLFPPRTDVMVVYRRGE